MRADAIARQTLPGAGVAAAAAQPALASEPPPSYPLEHCERLTIDTKLDHFDADELRTWELPIYVCTDFWDPETPGALFIHIRECIGCATDAC